MLDLERDRIVDAISSGQLNSNNISIDKIREMARPSKDLWEDLDRGRAILPTPAHLDQYLHSYAPMIKSQWSIVLSEIEVSTGRLTIFDYGCGQGLAIMLLLERYGSNLSGRVNKLVLIEPSYVALRRAEKILGCYLPDCNVRPVNKCLDEVSPDDLEADDDDVKLHLFSNVIDVEGFDQYSLLREIFSNKGLHCVLAVGNDRNTHGGSERLEMLFNLLHDDGHRDWLTIHDSKIQRFETDGGKKAIYFHVMVEV